MISSKPTVGPALSVGLIRPEDDYVMKLLPTETNQITSYERNSLFNLWSSQLVIMRLEKFIRAYE